MNTPTLVATVQQQDPYDERDGPWFSNADLKALAALPVGTKLYTGSRSTEEAHRIEVDRDIKAANLQLLVDKVLVDKVLAWEVQDSVFQVAPEVQEPWGELMSLARSLKQ